MGVPYGAMTTSAVYLRISKDKGLGTEDEGLAVDRQRKDIHKLLKRKGWTVGKEYLDNDVSASGKVPRPAYAQMLADFESGEIDAIAAWKLDRLWRVPKELEHIIDLVEKSSLTVATTDNDIDLATSSGRVIARVLTAFAQDELDKRSARQKAKFAQDREAGRNHWRGRRPFGLTLEGKEVPEEADVIREMAESIINGGTIAGNCAMLNKRGILTSFDKPWTRQPLRRLMLHPRLAGLLKHDVQIIKGKDGQPDTETYELIPGNWDAILDRDTWDAVCNVLNTPGRAKPKFTGKEFLLSGLLTCGKCKGKCYGTRVRYSMVKNKVRETYVYRCTLTHVSKVLRQTEELVIMQTLAKLYTMDLGEVVADKAALKALRESRALLVKDWSEWMKEAIKEKLRPSEIRPAREAHEAELAELDRQVREFEKVSLVRMPTPEEEEDGVMVAFEWDAMSLERKRRMIETVWESITLIPTKKGARWDPNTIKFVARV